MKKILLCYRMEVIIRSGNMKTKDFKELCAVYSANPNLDNENVLLRTMIFDTKFYVATKKYDYCNLKQEQWCYVFTHTI